MKTTIPIAFSPCPNDTYIFDGLVNGTIDTGDLCFEPVLEDVETLNQWALEGKFPITKLSYGVLSQVLDRYWLLRSGSALGKGVGPLLVSREDRLEKPVEDYAVAIPGEHTTAHQLFRFAYPTATHKRFLRYDAIEQFVLDGKGLGVIIHENRFTYAQKGLFRVTDLGDRWEQQQQVPIPLGGIVVSKKLDQSLANQIQAWITESIALAHARYPVLTDFIRCHAQEMSEDVMRQHIQLYVNEYSSDLGTTGKHAVLHFLNVGTEGRWKPGDVFLPG